MKRAKKKPELGSTYARGGLAKGVLGVYKGGGWVKNDQKRAYVICTQPLIHP